MWTRSTVKGRTSLGVLYLQRLLKRDNYEETSECVFVLRLLNPDAGVESSNLDSKVENVAELLNMKTRMSTAATIVSGSAKFAAKERGLAIWEREGGKEREG